MCDLSGITWLYRGVPYESDERLDVEATAEIRPPRPERTTEYDRRVHVMNNDTNTGYTSWTPDRSIAQAAAEAIGEVAGLSGQIVIFRVRANSISEERIFPGRDDEEELLIQGTIEEVEISEDAIDEDDYE